jgi:hypothetical protein
MGEGEAAGPPAGALQHYTGDGRWDWTGVFSSNLNVPVTRVRRIVWYDDAMPAP